ncbi:MAG: pseudouridine synthase [Planctomycetia bacterium]|nr:pseudouridine synthase [Planctomycetia bacterium]
MAKGKQGRGRQRQSGRHGRVGNSLQQFRAHSRRRDHMSMQDRRAAAHSVFSRGEVKKSSDAFNADDGEFRGWRLQQVLAAAGYGSRRSCEEYITSGRVEIDGQVVTELGVRVNPAVQKIHVDGQLMRQSRPVYLAFNKPKNTLCTNRDPSGRRMALDFIPPRYGRVFPVGRLDQNSEGLLILTNDGALAERLTHPRFEAPKKYRVQVAGLVDHELVNALKRGVHIAEGIVQADDVTIRTQHKLSSTLEITLTEGKNREIRRMLATVGHKVMNLRRIQVGPIKLGKMAPGEYRELSAYEVQSLYRLADFRPGKKEDDPADSPIAPVEMGTLLRREEEKVAARLNKAKGSGASKRVDVDFSDVTRAQLRNSYLNPVGAGAARNDRPRNDQDDYDQRMEHNAPSSRTRRANARDDRDYSARKGREPRAEFREEFRERDRDRRARMRRDFDDQERTIGPRKFNRNEEERTSRFNYDASERRGSSRSRNQRKGRGR